LRKIPRSKSVIAPAPNDDKSLFRAGQARLCLSYAAADRNYELCTVTGAGLSFCALAGFALTQRFKKRYCGLRLKGFRKRACSTF
jgi:hypothetical protein